jgi:hypothetical protein
MAVWLLLSSGCDCCTETLKHASMCRTSICGINAPAVVLTHHGLTHLGWRTLLSPPPLPAGVSLVDANDTSFTANATLNEASSVAYVVLPNPSDMPTPAEVRAGMWSMCVPLGLNEPPAYMHVPCIAAYA